MSSPQPPSGPPWQAPPPPPPRFQPPAFQPPAFQPPATQQVPHEASATMAVHEAPGAATGPGHSDAHEHSRLALLLALSIAVVSVLGAVVGWRAEIHASKANRFEQDSVASAISNAQVRSQAEADAAKAYSNYAHYVRLGHEASELDPSGCDGGTDTTTLTGLDATAVCNTRVQFSAYANDAYVQHNRFGIDRYVNDVLAVDATRGTADPEVYQARAETERHHEDRMLYLSISLVLSLALLTLARLGRSTVRRLLLAVPGWACLVGGAVFLVVAEF